MLGCYLRLLGFLLSARHDALELGFEVAVLCFSVRGVRGLIWVSRAEVLPVWGLVPEGICVKVRDYIFLLSLSIEKKISY